MTPLLQDKNVVVYGAGGYMGDAVARAFALEEARVFRAGRTGTGLDEVARVDAFDGRRGEGSTGA
jgi:NAD(P)-dependent dehydrogenase (short-subunit alcohol dehydrogenase family)